MAELRFVGTGREPIKILGDIGNTIAANQLCKSAKITNHGSEIYGEIELTDGKRSFFYDHTTTVHLLTNKSVAIEFTTVTTTYVNTSQKLPLAPRTSTKSMTLKIDGLPIEVIPHQLILNNYENMTFLVRNLVNISN